MEEDLNDNDDVVLRQVTAKSLGSMNDRAALDMLIQRIGMERNDNVIIDICSSVDSLRSKGIRPSSLLDIETLDSVLNKKGGNANVIDQSRCVAAVQLGFIVSDESLNVLSRRAFAEDCQFVKIAVRSSIEYIANELSRGAEGGKAPRKARPGLDRYVNNILRQAAMVISGEMFVPGGIAVPRAFKVDGKEYESYSFEIAPAQEAYTTNMDGGYTGGVYTEHPAVPAKYEERYARDRSSITKGEYDAAAKRWAAEAFYITRLSEKYGGTREAKDALTKARQGRLDVDGLAKALDIGSKAEAAMALEEARAQIPIQAKKEEEPDEDLPLGDGTGLDTSKEQLAIDLGFREDTRVERREERVERRSVEEIAELMRAVEVHSEIALSPARTVPEGVALVVCSSLAKRGESGMAESLAPATGRSYRVMMQGLRKVFSRNGEALVAEAATRDEMAALARGFIGRGLKVVILDEGLMPADATATGIGGRAGEDYCIVKAASAAERAKDEFEFVNINAMALMGVGVLSDDARLFSIAYKIFTGTEPSPETMAGLRAKALWLVRVLPRIVRLSEGLQGIREMQRLFEVAA
jgi:hypothetical protein